MSAFEPVFKIAPGVQSYDWGKVGSSSLAAQYAETCIDGFKTDDKKPYAELWMGTHVTLPSHVQSTSQPLADLLASDAPRYLSKKVIQKYPNAEKGQLPFLLKVLSIGKALSIQAHPDKKLAEKLFAERPEVYKDDNHKPEMAIALTPFRGFCGFLPLPQLLFLLSTIPEMKSLIGPSTLNKLAASLDLKSVEELDIKKLESSAEESVAKSAKTVELNETQKSALKEVFEKLMTASEEQVKSTLSSLVQRYTSEPSGTSSAEKTLIPLVLELNEQYPEDVGVLCCFILNVVELEVGKSVFLGADEPHAYISGDIVECMATSDNVVRAGLTPKLRDVDTLLSMLTYTSAPAHAQLLTTSTFGKKTELFDPPIEEFSVLRTHLETQGDKEAHRGIEGPSICIITEGSGELSGVKADRGDVLFVAPEFELELTAGEKGMTVFRAYVEA